MEEKLIYLPQPLQKTYQVDDGSAPYTDYDDAYYNKGWNRAVLAADRFVAQTLDGDDVVIDMATGLMWAADGNADGCNMGNTNDWAFAIGDAFALTFAEFSDWRLPNVNELLSIHTPSRCVLVAGQNNAIIDETLFPNTANAKYWTSTTAVENSANAWSVNAGYATLGRFAKSPTAYYMRYVRTVVE